MKKREKKSKVEKLLTTVEKLRKENHNLKRQLKRRDDKLQDIENQSVKVDCSSKVDEVIDVSIDDIKKKLREQGLTEREIEITVLFMSKVTDL